MYNFASDIYHPCIHLINKQDGSERKVVVDSKIVYPYGVAVDYPNRHIFWVDTYLDYIERAGNRHQGYFLS